MKSKIEMGSIKTAEKVLRELKKILAVEAYASMYKNGRENGYVITKSEAARDLKQAVFS